MVPTGVHIRDVRQQLFDAAERVLLRGGPSVLTGRALTAEAGVAKGVLHRHFESFDDFLVEFVRSRVGRIEAHGESLRRRAGTGTVAGNLVDALNGVFDPVAVALVAVATYQPGLSALQHSGRADPGIPILSEAGAAISRYLIAERELGRIAADADADALGLSLTGAAYLLFAGSRNGRPEAGVVDRVVDAVVADVVQRRLL